MKHAAIPTVYKDVQMRSRLEARWAAFFSLCECTWQYEPFDLEGWIPDFLLDVKNCDKKLLVEVKPLMTNNLPRELSDEILNALDLKTLIDNRVSRSLPPPPAPIDDEYSMHLYSWKNWKANVAQEKQQIEYAEWSKSLARKMEALPSIMIVGIDPSVTFRLRPDGLWDSNIYGRDPKVKENTMRTWALAGNAVQWKPPRKPTHQMFGQVGVR